MGLEICEHSSQSLRPPSPHPDCHCLTLKWPGNAAQDDCPGWAAKSQITARRDNRVRLPWRELRLSGEQFVEEARGLQSRRAVVAARAQTYDEDAVRCLDARRLQG